MNPNVKSTYEPQKQLTLTNLYSYTATFVYQPLLPTNDDPLNHSTVTFPLAHVMLRNHRMFNRSLAEEQFYVGNPHALEATTYSKPLMMSFTNECKESVPITPLGSKPITNQALAGILTLSQKGPLPEWKLSSFDENPLQWPGWFGQFKSAIDAKVMKDDVKLACLKTLLSVKAKNAIAVSEYSETFYKDSSITLVRIFGQPQRFVAAHRKKLPNFPISHLSSNISFV